MYDIVSLVVALRFTELFHHLFVAMFRVVVTILILIALCNAPSPIDNDLRNSIVFQRLGLGLSTRVVSALNDGVSERTIRRIVARYRRHVQYYLITR